MNTVIVIGANHYNTLGLLRSLGEAEYRPILILIDIDPDESFVAHCKYISKLIRTTEDALPDLLINMTWENKPILFPAGDNIAKIIDNNYDLLSLKYYCPNIKKTSGALYKAMNKESMRIAAKNVGLNTPDSWIVHSDENIPFDIEYPCIIKPIDSTVGHKSTDIIKNEHELKQALNKMFIETKDIQIQHYVKKEKEIIYLGWSHKGKVCIPCFMEKIRDYPVGFGCTGLGRYSPEVNKYLEVSKLIELVQYYEYSGLFSIEFIIANEEVYFLEINFRNDGNGYFPGFGGCNLAVGYIRAVLRDDFSMCLKVIDRTYQMMREFTDLRYCANTHYPVFKWIKDIISTDVFQYWNLKDLSPFFFILKRKIKHRLFRYQ